MKTAKRHSSKGRVVSVGVPDLPWSAPIKDWPDERLETYIENQRSKGAASATSFKTRFAEEILRLRKSFRRKVA